MFSCGGRDSRDKAEIGRRGHDVHRWSHWALPESSSQSGSCVLSSFKGTTAVSRVNRAPSQPCLLFREKGRALGPGLEFRALLPADLWRWARGWTSLRLSAFLLQGELESRRWRSTACLVDTTGTAHTLRLLLFPQLLGDGLKWSLYRTKSDETKTRFFKKC